MNVFRYNDSSIACVEYVKTVLPHIGNISSFQVYFHDQDIPKQYRNVPDIDVYDGKVHEMESTYLFIAKNEKEDKELWLTGCTCGYGGTGPSTTQEVLELLGVKIDYSRIYNEKKIILKEITTHHDLNFIVYNPSTENPYRAGMKRFKVESLFEYPDQKWNAKEALKSLGVIKPLRSIEKKSNRFFSTKYSTDKEHFNYSTNNGLVLGESWSKLDDDVMINLIQDYINNYGGSYQVKKIEENAWYNL